MRRLLLLVLALVALAVAAAVLDVERARPAGQAHDRGDPRGHHDRFGRAHPCQGGRDP